MLDRLSMDVGSTDIGKLAGRRGEWRIRVGRWRVILELDNTAGLINVARVLPRKDTY